MQERKVTADILFFKKRDQILEEDSELPSWVESKRWNEAEDISVNNYFFEHPEDVIGNLEKKSTAFGFDITCNPSEDRGLEEQLQEAVSSMSANYQEREGEKILPTQIEELTDKRPFSFFYREGKLYYQNANRDEEITELTATQRDRVGACIQVREMVRSVIEAQKNNESDAVIKTLQRKFNEVYDAYVDSYGRIGTDKELKKIFEIDASYPLLCSLEIFKEGNFLGKSDIFSKRTINPYVAPEHADTAADALMISMQGKRKSRSFLYGKSEWYYARRTY